MKKEIEISPNDSLLVFKKGYTPEFVFETIHKKNLNGLRIFAILNEDRLSNINFLSDYSFLKSLDITSVDDYSFDFFERLHSNSNPSL